MSWLLNARNEQFLPPGNWKDWLMLSGRGWGKSRAGAETVRMWAKNYSMINIIGATSDNVRDIMIEGESGILRICPKRERPLYQPSKRRLLWPNGGKTLIFTADSPELIRGKQSEKLWLDELASWRYPEAYDQAMFGLRLGDAPQTVITTTPRPTKLIKELVKASTTFVTRGTTYDNQANLSPSFFAQIIKKYEGTRLGRQELLAEILDDNPNALWLHENIDKHRVSQLPQLKRVVIGVDPKAKMAEGSSETGIIVAGIDYNDHGYVFADKSIMATPEGWSAKVVSAFHQYKANLIVAEINNGGDMVVSCIRTQDRALPVKTVHATRGKDKRAEPIAALYEQGRIHHVGTLPQLEDQMCEFDPTLTETQPTDRMDGAVWALTELMIKPHKEFAVL